MSSMTTVHDRREIYRGRAFTVTVDDVTLPSGHRAAMDVVRHPGSVVLVPFTAQGELILIRQYRYVIDRYVWELPAGTLEPGEALEVAARRECEEEIGLVPGRIETVGALFPTPGICDELMTFFRCSELGPPPPDSTAAKDDDEVIEPRAFPLAEVRAMLGRGDIMDMKTVAALALLRL